LTKENEQRFKIWTLRQSGLSQAAIAEKVGVSQSTVSVVCKFLDDAEIIHQMIEAEESDLVTSGDRNIDALEAQARNLQRAQARCGSGTPEYAKRAELIGWLLLKSAQLRQALPNSGKDRVQYNYKAVSGIRPSPRVKQMDTKTIDRALLQDFELAHRVAKLECSECGAEVWAKIDVNYNTEPLPESPVDYSKEDVEEE
jgi:transcriptional regulator with XRE-family HTH domain